MKKPSALLNKEFKFQLAKKYKVCPVWNKILKAICLNKVFIMSQF